MKTWFITGASSGFGRSLTETLLADGARVVATARKKESLDALVRLAPERVLPLSLDVTDPAQILAARDEAEARFGPVDVVVNNAGFSIVGAVEETSEQALRETMEPMFFGAFNVTRAFLPAMRARRSGTFVQLSSVGGLTTGPGFAAYCAAKHALEGFSETLATEVARFGLRVLIVEPGAFRTSLFGSGFRSPPALPAYETSVGATRKYVEQMAGTQPGDPARAARAIIDAVSAGAPNLRLPLGRDAMESIRAKVKAVTADLDASERVATDMHFR